MRPIVPCPVPELADSRRTTIRIGVLVPFTNTNLEPDLALLLPPEVSVHTARLGGYDVDAIPDDDQMAEMGASDIEEPLRLLAGTHPDLILYGCTSATLTHGFQFDRALAERIATQTGARTVTAAGALVHTLKHHDIKRIGFASPYVGAINDQAEAFLAEAGFETVRRAEFDRALDNREQGALTPDHVHALGLAADDPAADAIVLSCTDMRSVEAIPRLEDALGKPIISSNQAMVFQALSLLGLGANQSNRANNRLSA